MFDEMSVSMFHLHMRSLVELKQTGTVVEYTAAFWERLHPVLDLNPNLTIKGFVYQYVEGLRDDIQAAVRSRSPSSITCASSLARIREDEIVKDKATGADQLGDSDNSYGFTPTNTLTDVFPEHAPPVQGRAGHSVTTIDASCHAALTPTCSAGCPSSDATADVVPKLAASAESVMGFDSVAALTPATCSTGGLPHGHDNDTSAGVSLVLWTTPLSSTPAPATPTSLRWSSSVLELVSTPTRCWHLQGSEFLDTLQPAQLDYLVPPAEPPDRRYATVVNAESSAWFSTSGVKGTSLEILSTEVVINCYSMESNECRTQSTLCDAIKSCDTYLEHQLLKFDSIAEHPCFTMISNQWYVLLERMQSLIEGQCTYSGDRLTKIVDRYVQSLGKINVIVSCPCSKQICRPQGNLEVLIFRTLEKWSHTQFVQPANAVFEAHLKFLSKEAGSVLHIGATYALHRSSFGGHYLQVLAAWSNFRYEFYNVGVSCLFVPAWRFYLDSLKASHKLYYVGCTCCLLVENSETWRCASSPGKYVLGSEICGFEEVIPWRRNTSSLGDSVIDVDCVLDENTLPWRWKAIRPEKSTVMKPTGHKWSMVDLQVENKLTSIIRLWVSFMLQLQITHLDRNWDPGIPRYVLCSVFKLVNMHVLIQFLHNPWNLMAAFHLVRGNPNMLKIFSYGVVLSVSILTTNLMLRTLHLIQITCLEVGYNRYSAKAKHFQHRHVLETDSIKHVVGEALLNVWRDFHLLGHCREQSYVSVPRVLQLTLDIQWYSHSVILDSEMHLQYHEGWTFYKRTIVSTVKAYHFTTIQAVYVCGIQQSSSTKGKSTCTVWSGYMDNISVLVTMPWDPGGISGCGLRASLILRGRECHVRLLTFWALSSWALGCVCWAWWIDEAYKGRRQLLAEGIE